MLSRSLLSGMVLVLSTATSLAEDDKPLGPVEARNQVGKKITVEMTVKAAKDRLEKHGEIYLDAEENFKDPKNFAVIITKAGAAKFKEAGIAAPADHFRSKLIRAKGTVKVVQEVPRIEIDDRGDLQIVEK
jgi:hypothetical protein